MTTLGLGIIIPRVRQQVKVFCENGLVVEHKEELESAIKTVLENRKTSIMLKLSDSETKTSIYMIQLIC